MRDQSSMDVPDRAAKAALAMMVALRQATRDATDAITALDLAPTRWRMTGEVENCMDW